MTRTLYETRLVNALEIRDNVANNSASAKFGNIAFSKGVLSIENDLDQNVTCQLQGKAVGAETWQNAGASVVAAAGGVNTISVTVPWGILRLQMTAAGVPTTGTISAWLNLGR